MNSAELPRVVVNFIMTIDGKVSTRNWTPAAFGSTRDRERLQEIRAQADAIMVGRKTAEIDQMKMGISSLELREIRTRTGRSPEPLRVIISGRGNLDLQMKVFDSAGAPIVIFTKNVLPQQISKMLVVNGTIHTLEDREFLMKKILQILYCEHRVRTLVCEGGPTLMRSLLEADVVDEVNLTIAPLIFGGHLAPTLTGLPGSFLRQPLDFQLKSMETHDEECFLVYERNRRNSAIK